MPKQESGDEPELDNDAAIDGAYSKVTTLNPQALKLEYETVNRKSHILNPKP